MADGVQGLGLRSILQGLLTAEEEWGLVSLPALHSAGGAGKEGSISAAPQENVRQAVAAPARLGTNQSQASALTCQLLEDEGLCHQHFRHLVQCYRDHDCCFYFLYVPHTPPGRTANNPPKSPQVTINLGALSRHIILPTVQAPAALGLTTFLVVSRWPRGAAVRALLLFAAATPAAAVVTAGLLSLTPW